jgi:hypothetical protein
MPSHLRYKFTDEDLKFVHILEAVNYLRIAGNGGLALPQTFFEFGCHSGRTFSSAINASLLLKMPQMKFYAFDSFEGLPKTSSDDGYFESGSFCTTYQQFLKIVRKSTGINLNSDSVIKGFYCDSLTSELRDKMPRVGIVHIDVDLYSSTIDVLNFIGPLLVPGSLILFDDWFCFPGGTNLGERKAFLEFLGNNSWIKVEPWKSYSTFGQSFFITQISQD